MFRLVFRILLWCKHFSWLILSPVIRQTGGDSLSKTFLYSQLENVKFPNNLQDDQWRSRTLFPSAWDLFLPNSWFCFLHKPSCSPAVKSCQKPTYELYNQPLHRAVPSQHAKYFSHEAAALFHLVLICSTVLVLFVSLHRRQDTSAEIKVDFNSKSAEMRWHWSKHLSLI